MRQPLPLKKQDHQLQSGAPFRQKTNTNSTLRVTCVLLAPMGSALGFCNIIRERPIMGAIGGSHVPSNGSRLLIANPCGPPLRKRDEKEEKAV